MNDYVTFEACITPMLWGETVYTVLPLPPDVLDALGAAKRVEGEFGEHPVNLAIAKAPKDVIDTPFLWTGKSLLDRIGIAPGDVFEARLRPSDPDLVEVPGDVMRALRSAGAVDAWDALAPGNRRGALHQIDLAKRAATRASRITKLIGEVT